MRKQLVISMGLALTLILAIVLGRSFIFAQPVAEDLADGGSINASPGPTAGRHIALPAFDVADDWETWVMLQNLGSTSTKAALVMWGEPGQCDPQGAGPMGVECTGLLKPGTSWLFKEVKIPETARSGIIYSVSSEQVYFDSGPSPGYDFFADRLCDALSTDVVGDDQAWRDFDQAFRAGKVWSAPDGTEFDFGQFVGQPLAVIVSRKRTGEGGPASAASTYTGVSEEMEGTYDDTLGGFAYFAPLVAVGDQGETTSLIVQNLGNGCASFELRYQPQDDCSQVTIDEVLALAPGEAVGVDPGDVLTAPFRGSAWIRADQPLAVVVDQWALGGNVLMTFRGVAQANSSLVHYAPLVYRDFEGWNASLNVQNIHSTTDAKGKTYFLDSSGDIIYVIVDWICARGTQSYHLSDIDDLPEHYAGPARMESQEWWTPGDPTVFITNIVSNVDLVNEEAGQGASYNALPAPQEGGVEYVGLPLLMKGTTRTSRIAIQNLNPNPGFTDFTFALYDQNGLLDYVYERLNGNQVEYIDLDTWGTINPGWVGSGVVRVDYSTQDGEPALAVVVFEPDDGTTGGDLSMAYEGVVLSTGGVEPVTPTPTPPTTPEPTATATSIATPTPSPTATPTGSSPPTITPTPTSTPLPFPPDTRITLPSIVTGDGWETGIHVQNAGETETQVVMDLYAVSTGLCPPESPDVIATLCSGLLKPGSTWTWTSSDLPQEARSAIVYSVLPGSQDVICGGNGTRKPGSPLAVTVERLRRGEGGAVLQASSYTGIAQWGEPDPESGNYVYFTPVTLGGLSGWNTSMTAQNAGEACTSLKIVYQASADGRESTLEIPALAPGEAVRIDPRDIVPSPFQGSAWIESPQPLAILVDQWYGEEGSFMSSNGAQSLGARINYAPLAYKGFEGWAASIQVQNLSDTTDARVRVDLLDGQGEILTTIREWIEPLGLQTFSIPPGGAPEGRVDAVRVESENWESGESSPLEVPRVFSRVSLTSEETGQSLTYNAFSVREGSGRLVALPRLVKNSSPSSQIIIQNLGAGPGFTKVRLELYDQQGLYALRLDRLGPNQAHHIDINAWEAIPADWTGAGLVRVLDSTQVDASSVGVIVVEGAGGAASGDLPRAYEGVPLASGSALHKVYLPVGLKSWAPAGP